MKNKPWWFESLDECIDHDGEVDIKWASKVFAEAENRLLIQLREEVYNLPGGVFINDRVKLQVLSLLNSKLNSPDEGKEV